MGRKKAFDRNHREWEMARNLDNLAAYEEFCADLPGKLKKDLLSGLSTEELYKKYETLAAARAIAIATTEQDSSKALAAIKDILDRSRGKATDKSEITHKYSDLKEEELDSLILTKLADGADDTQDETVQ